MEGEWNLILPFDTDDPEFCRGFEVGRLWERIKADHTSWEETIHATNAEMVIRMCEFEGRSYRTEALDDTFLQVFVSSVRVKCSCHNLR